VARKGKLFEVYTLNDEAENEGWDYREEDKAGAGGGELVKNWIHQWE
jgi:hypothetical protein